MVIIMMSSSCVKRRLAEAGKWVSHKSDNTETDGDRQREEDKKKLGTEEGSADCHSLALGM